MTGVGARLALLNGCAVRRGEVRLSGSAPSSIGFGVNVSRRRRSPLFWERRRVLGLSILPTARRARVTSTKRLLHCDLSVVSCSAVLSFSRPCCWPARAFLKATSRRRTKKQETGAQKRDRSNFGRLNNGCPTALASELANPEVVTAQLSPGAMIKPPNPSCTPCEKDTQVHCSR